MKIYFLSDLHGSAYYLEKFFSLESLGQEDYLVLLGDLLYHGARNPLPKGHDPKLLVELLNKEKERIIAVRGNCDSEVDQTVLDFPIMADYNSLIYGGRRLFLSHGHIYNEENLPSLRPGDCFISGHSHIARAEKKGPIYYLNPGSLGLPKGQTDHSFGLLEGSSFKIKDLEGRVLKEIDLK